MRYLDLFAQRCQPAALNRTARQFEKQRLTDEVGGCRLRAARQRLLGICEIGAPGAGYGSVAPGRTETDTRMSPRRSTLW